jgi:tetratricopeptide (TPR) repeat protein
VFYSNRAQCHLKLGDVSAAIDDWTQAQVLDPQRSKTHACLGKAYTQLGRLDDARACYQRALDTAATGTGMATGDARGVAQMGLAHVSEVEALVARAAQGTGTDGEARLRAVDEVLVHCPASLPHQLLRVQCLRDARRFDEALAAAAELRAKYDGHCIASYGHAKHLAVYGP